MVSEPRVAIGIDVTVACVSVARFVEGKPNPIGMPVEAPDAGTAHSPASTLHRHKATVTQVMEIATKRGRPDVVVMVKNHWLDMAKDPSADRRSGLWWLIAEALVVETIPVAEVPLLTLSSWAGARPMPGKKGADLLIEKAQEYYPSVSLLAGTGFRPTTYAAALAGAMAIGVETEIPVTQDRLNTLRGYIHADARERSNKGVQWPATCKVPATVADWLARHNREDTPAEKAG